MKEKGLTLVPTKLYFKDGRVKLEVALGRGKDQARQAPHDRRPRREAADGARAAGAAVGAGSSRTPAGSVRPRERRAQHDLAGLTT